MRRGFILTPFILALAIVVCGYVGYEYYKPTKQNLNVGAPVARYERELTPVSDSTQYLGTTSPSTIAWRGLIVDEICFTGDSCETAWPLGGGGGSGGTWSTTTSGVTGQLFNYPNNNDDIVTIGSNSSTTAEFYYDPNIQSLFVKSASSTIAGVLDVVGNFKLPLLSQGLLYNGSGGLTNSVGTTTLTASSPLSLSQPVVKVGGSNSVLTIDTSGTWSGNAGTASALAANGANCSAGSFPLGVDASGAVESCFDVWTEAENTAAGYVANTRTLTVAGTANQITSSAGAQDLSANRTWTLSIPSQFNIQQASTTILSAHWLKVGATASTTIDTAGNITIPSSSSLTITGTSDGCANFTSGVLGSTGSACGSGGGSGGGTWATTTSTVVGQLINYPLNATDIVTVGSNSTTTAEFWFDPNLPRLFLTYASTTYVSFTTASTTNLVASNSVKFWDKLWSSFADFTTEIRGMFTAGDHLTLTAGDFDVDDDFILNTGDVGTGVYDFGGATSLEIPNGATPTMDAIGQLALDTTSNNLIMATSTSGHVVIGSATTTLYSFTASTTSIVSGTIIDMASHPLQQVATKLWCKVSGGTSLQIFISDGTNDTNTITCTTTGTEYALTANNTFTPYEAIRMEFGTKTGDTGYLSARIMGYRVSD